MAAEDEVQRLDGILTAFQNAVFLIDADRRVTWISAGLIEAYGQPWEIGSDSNARTHPDDLEAADRYFAEALANPRRKIRYSTRASHAAFPDVYWTMDVTIMNLLDDPAVGAIACAFGPHADQLDDQIDEGAMRLTDIMPVGVIQSMADGSCYYRNRLAVQQLGPIPLGEPADAWIERAVADDREPLRRAQKDALAGNRSDAVVAGFPKAGGVAWFRFEFTPQLTATGTPSGWMATSLDVTVEIEARNDLQVAQRHLWHLANHDALTGLPNRPAVLDRIDAALARDHREHHGVALLYCDLDGFKPVNDQHGHEAGDVVLCAVAEQMRLAVRETDAVGRLGGDEFVVLCESFSSITDVEAVAERVRSFVSQPITLDGASVVELGVTIGVAVAAPGERRDALLARADRAMYQGKPVRRPA